MPVLGVVIVGLAPVTLGNFSAVTAAQLGVAGATDRDRGLASAMYFSVYYLAGALGGYVPGLAWEAVALEGRVGDGGAAYAVGAAALIAATTLARPCAPSPATPADSSSSSRYRLPAIRLRPRVRAPRRELVTLTAASAGCADLDLAASTGSSTRRASCARAACSPARARPMTTPRGSSASATPRQPSAGCSSSSASWGCRQSWRERDGGLAFELLSGDRGPVTTGHADGVVTLDLAESDDVHREALREQLGEPYRTVLGHFRHEIAHYYLPLLVPDGPARERCRALFGDEREDYGAALERHYASGPPLDWSQRRQRLRDDAPVGGLGGDLRPLPAHRDTLQTAGAFGVNVRGAEERRRPAATSLSLLDDWLPLTFGLNALSRAGRDDLYGVACRAWSAAASRRGYRARQHTPGSGAHRGPVRA